MDLQSAHVLLAGATGGIGSALARQLAAAGATLSLVARDADRLAQLPVDGHRFAVDLRMPDGAQQTVSEAVAHGGELHVVINAVGVVAFGDTASLSSDALEELFLTNVFAGVFLSQAALPHMAVGGAMVSMSGVISERNLPGMAAYGASKAAVRAFSEGFAREARRAKVRVVDARPPHTETGLADRAIAGDAPAFPPGLTPDAVAATIVAALVDDSVKDLPSGAFS